MLMMMMMMGGKDIMHACGSLADGIGARAFTPRGTQRERSSNVLRAALKIFLLLLVFLYCFASKFIRVFYCVHVFVLFS